ncbi:unnamed protein product [Ostreobium quekettii]|uniref:thiamine phosphate synthase n=1 Tax=Ostreobium quekettii TaxID=121088 RepID=A0A8S1J6D5_9CHLO|nr:unnamed protein product [Ostreobium quekettii]|eukprot:evm.model.scf_64.11 EVM.evm.TU.scf_64.11   scf_64:100832-111921(-)
MKRLVSSALRGTGAPCPLSVASLPRLFSGPSVGVCFWPRRSAVVNDPAHGRHWRTAGQLWKQCRCAVELEVRHFSDHQPASGTAHARNIGVLVVDFDNTLTTGDTTVNLIAAVIAAAGQRLGGTPEEEDRLVQERMQVLRGAAEAYQAALDALIEDLISQFSTAKGKPEFDMGTVRNMCVKLSEHDRYWCQRTIDTGILKGARREDVEEAAVRGVTLWEGCLDVLGRARQKGWGVRVLSQNWSAHLIKSMLGDDAAIPEGKADAARDAILITSNELAYESEITTGDVTRVVECADDKGQVFDNMLLEEMSREGRDPHSLSVYIGDGPGDILPLLAADFGIVFNKNKTMGDILRTLCIEIKPLTEAPMDPKLQGDMPVLYETASWHDISVFLYGPGMNMPAQEPDPPISVPRVLIVAGSDSGGGAGIQADIKTCLMNGAFGCVAVTSLTFQNTQGIEGAHNVPTDAIEAQIDAVLSDIGANAVKTGMLPTAEVVELVARKVAEYKIESLVVDPVLVSTSGQSLAENDVGGAIREALMPLATVVTPNVPEAEALLGGRTIRSVDDMEVAARELHEFGPKYVLVKGGHLVSNAQKSSHSGLEVVDVLYDGNTILHLRQPAIMTGNTHGTGCTLASAIASELAKGASPCTAVENAKEYITDVLKSSKGIRTGRGAQQPLNHGSAIVDWGAQVRKPSVQLRDLRLYAVTDSRMNRKRNRSMTEAASLAISGGASIIQLREKAMPTQEFVTMARDVLAAARPRGVKVVINDRVDVALAVDADGVHVGQEDMPAADARRLLGKGKVLGVSAKTVEQAVKAEEDGADYVGAGAVFPTSTKESSVIGLEGLRDICSAVSIPVVAIGGVAADNALSTVLAGCKGVAVVSSLFDVGDPQASGRAILALVNLGLEKG